MLYTFCLAENWRLDYLTPQHTAGCPWVLGSSVIRSDHYLPSFPSPCENSAVQAGIQKPESVHCSCLPRLWGTREGGALWSRAWQLSVVCVYVGEWAPSTSLCCEPHQLAFAKVPLVGAGLPLAPLDTPWSKRFWGSLWPYHTTVLVNLSPPFHSFLICRNGRDTAWSWQYLVWGQNEAVHLETLWKL